MHLEIGEINVICTDLDRSLRFYRDVLGFEALESEGPAWHMACGSVKFLLLEAAEMPHIPSPYCRHPEFSIDLLVEDLESTYRHYRASGVVFVSEFMPNSDRFMIRDPDGLVFEVIGK